MVRVQVAPSVQHEYAVAHSFTIEHGGTLVLRDWGSHAIRAFAPGQWVGAFVIDETPTVIQD